MCQNCRVSRASVSRRNVIAGAGALLAASALPLAPARAASRPATNAPNAIPPAAALAQLLKGNARYAANEPVEKDFSAGRAARVEAQFPIAAILGCSDSRVSPELLFDQGPGDLFVVRLAGNFLERRRLRQPRICREVPRRAARHGAGPHQLRRGRGRGESGDRARRAARPSARADKSIEPAVIAAHGRHPSDLVAAAIEENVRLNVKRLIDDTPIMSDALAAKKIAIAGGIYDLATGNVTLI